MSHSSRSYAVGIIEQGRVDSIPENNLSLQEAVAFVRSYNEADQDRQAVILTHPISRAISHALPKSRVS
jgi:hypothetical protein